MLVEMLDVRFDNFKCGTKLNVAVVFALKNIKVRNCHYQSAHDNNTPIEKTKLVDTGEASMKDKTQLTKIDVIESHLREMANTKWKFVRLANVTFFDALFKKNPIG